MQLSTNTLLQGGKYRIECVLGQGGFGITYLATQKVTIDGPIGKIETEIKLAIKEFFMKEYCNRNVQNSYVSVPSDGSKELVNRFRAKFIKESKTIAALKHPHIIRIYDVFEENGTAYYAMEYVGHGSLSELIKRNGPLEEADALRYIRQIADALEYIHQRKMNHLDVKPSNILLDDKMNAVLIDFGLSKRYNEEGNQTSSTPVGISHGYAPMEQYNAGGVGTFSPATDIYSLGATLYKLLTGTTPPQANEVFNEGLPAIPSHLSASTVRAITKAMQPGRRDRPQSVAAFMALLSGEEENTLVGEETDVKPKPDPQPIPKPQPIPTPVPKLSPWKKWAVPLAVGILAALAVIFWPKGGDTGGGGTNTGTINGHTYVDLGLSVKWADRNVGASSPSDYGSYFAWGETSTKSDYSSSNSVTLEKSFGDIAGNSNYDAARANWGGIWRLPTKAELEELVSKCTWTWVTQGVHSGYKVVGPNGNSIFLPAAGCRDGTSLNRTGESGRYWISAPREGSTQRAYILLFYSSYHRVGWENRPHGQSIRPVSE